MKKREFCIILGSALLAAGVSGCKESASKKYSSAQELINKGEYSEAVKKLREIRVMKILLSYCCMQVQMQLR